MIETSFANNETFKFYFQGKSREEDNPSDKAVTVEELDVTENLVDLPRLIFIDEECEDLKVVVDGGQLTRNNKRKRKSKVLPAYRCPLCGKCYNRDRSKHDFSCGYIFLWVSST